MQRESTDKVNKTETSPGSSHGHESRRRNRRTDKSRRSEILPYLSSIKSEKLLSAAEESGLAEAIARGDKEARAG